MQFNVSLLPLELIYRIGVELWYLKWKKSKRFHLRKPTISIGNLTVGGTGKTPLTIYLSKKFLERGLRPAVLTRGYRRTSRKLIMLKNQNYSDVKSTGDEPILISKKLEGQVPVVVHKDRLKASERVAANLAVDVFILDDGHQYMKIKPDLALVTIGIEDMTGKPHLIPVGPFREPPSALRRADILVLNIKQNEKPKTIPKWLQENYHGKIFWMRYINRGFTNLRYDFIPIEGIKGKKLIALAGIANPKSFFRSLENICKRLDAVILRKKAFLDHHYFKEREIKSILKEAQREKVDFIVTTEKDLVRIPVKDEGIIALSIDVKFEDEEEFLKTIFSRLFPQL